MSQRTEQHGTLSELPFAVREEFLPIINEYTGNWVLSGEGSLPQNYWAVGTDGESRAFSGHGSPQQVLDLAQESGMDCAYVAPYGHYVEGELDAIQLHEWIRERRAKHRREEKGGRII